MKFHKPHKFVFAETAKPTLPVPSLQRSAQTRFWAAQPVLGSAAGFGQRSRFWVAQRFSAAIKAPSL